MFRWNSIRRRWPLERFLDTIDMDLTPAEKAPLDKGIHSWRQLVVRYLDRYDAP